MAGQVPGPLQMMLGQAPPPTLASLPSPVVAIGPQFVAPYPVHLVVRKKLLTLRKGEFAIFDVNGNVHFTIEGSFLTFDARHVLLDAAGNALATLRRKRWQVYRGRGSHTRDLLFSAQRSSIVQFPTKLNVFLAGNTRESAPDFQVKGDFWKRRCTIYLGSSNAGIAQVHRQFDLPTIALHRDTYGVTVSANVDYAFIAALVAVLHEINEDRRGEA